MTRVAIVIGSALAFAILGLVAGHLCVVAYSGVGIDIGGAMVRASGGRQPSSEFLVGCYLGPPVMGALIGFVVAIIALKSFGPAEK